MPYVSDAQRRLFHAKLARGQMKKRVVSEFDKTSEGDDLPEKVKKAFGGYIDSPEHNSPEFGLEPEDRDIGENFPQPYYGKQSEGMGDAGGYEENPQDDNVMGVKHGYSRGGRVKKYDEGGKVRLLMAIKRGHFGR